MSVIVVFLRPLGLRLGGSVPIASTLQGEEVAMHPLLNYKTLFGVLEIDS